MFPLVIFAICPATAVKRIFREIHLHHLTVGSITLLISFLQSQGHLQLLKHTFLHGVHDLNVVAAIIAPRSDDSIRRKCEDVGNTFMFGIGERCLLWEQHISLPTWAWVYQDTTKSFHGFVDRLKQKTKEDGYEVEFITMYGPEIGSPDDPPDPAYASYGSTTVIMSDAARDASFQRSNGRLKDFKGCSKWRRVCVNKAQLEERVRDHARRTMQRMNAACSGEAQISLEEGTSVSQLCHSLSKLSL